MKFTIAPMTIGEILSRGVSIFFTRIWLFLAVQVLVSSPSLVLQLAMPELAMGPGVILFVLPNIILFPIGSAAMLHVIAQEYLGRPVSLGDAFKFALGRFLPLLGTNLLGGFGIMLGMLLCCVPGFYLAFVWAFASQVVVMEDLAGSTALGRSKDLVSGYFWQVFGVLVIVGLLVAFASAPINIVLALALPFQAIPPPNPNNPFAALQAPPQLTSYVNFAINKIVSTGLAGIGQTFTAICTTLLYFDMRNRKEAFDVEHIVAWMDQVRDWRDEPAPAGAPPGSPAAAETGIKQVGDAVPPVPPPSETGIQDPNAPRSGNPPPP
jgi:hypothetical protein